MAPEIEIGPYACCLTITVICVLLGYLIFRGGLDRYKELQNVKITPTSKARSAAVGLIELVGKARPVKPTVGPLSKEKRAYWRMYAGCGRKNRDGFVDMGRSSEEGFYLEDEWGRILIPLYMPYYVGKKQHIGINFHCPHKKEHLTNMLTGYTSPAKEEIEKLSEEAQEKFRKESWKGWRFTEEYIEDGEDVYVLGRAVPAEREGSEVSQENLEIDVDVMAFSSEKDLLGELKKGAITQIIAGATLIGIGVLSASIVLLW